MLEPWKLPLVLNKFCHFQMTTTKDPKDAAEPRSIFPSPPKTLSRVTHCTSDVLLLKLVVQGTNRVWGEWTGSIFASCFAQCSGRFLESLAGNLLTLRICQIWLHRQEEEESISLTLTHLVLLLNLAAYCCILCCWIQTQRQKMVGSLSKKTISELLLKEEKTEEKRGKYLIN